MRPLPTLVLAAVLLALAAGRADAQVSPPEFWGHHRQAMPVVAVEGLTLADLPLLAPRGAIGLLVPSAGPRTSESLAFAGLVRGVLHNGRLGPRPNGPVLIRVQKLQSIPLADGAIVVGLPGRLTPNGRRYPVALLGACNGILTSSLTRVPGLVSMADIARTALRTPHALGCKLDANAVTTLTRLEQRVENARDSTMVGTVIVLGLMMAFALLLPSAALPALAAALAANLALGFLPSGGVGARLTLLGLCIAVGGVLGRRVSRSPVAVGLGFAALVAAYAVAMVVQPSSLSLAPLGPELTSRFYGVSNLLETLLLVPALAGAALLGRRFGPVAFAAAAALGLATIAENKLGADGGGAVVLGVGFAVLAVVMSRARLRMVVPALGIAAVVVIVLLNIDASTDSHDHLRGALSFGGIASVIAHRVPLSYARVLEQWYLVFPLAALAALLVRSRAWPASRDRRALLAALGAAVLTSLLVNDSPGPVTLGALAAFFALEPLALRRELAPGLSRFLRPAPVPAPAAVPAEQP